MNNRTGGQQVRVAKGVPTGGQFSFAPREESLLTLVQSPAAPIDDVFLSAVEVHEPIQLGRSRYIIDTTDTTDGSSDAQPHLAARNGASIAAYRDLADFDRRTLRHAAERGEQVTLLRIATVFNDVSVEEVTLGVNAANGRVTFKAKGGRKDYMLDERDVLDMARSHGHFEAMSNTWRRRKAEFVPTVEAVTNVDAVHALPGHVDENSPVQATYLLEDLGADANIPRGSLFFAVNKIYAARSEFLRGYLWRADGEADRTLVDLNSGYLQQHGGRVVDYPNGALTLGQVQSELPASRIETYRRITGRTWLADD